MLYLSYFQENSQRILLRSKIHSSCFTKSSQLLWSFRTAAHWFTQSSLPCSLSLSHTHTHTHTRWEQTCRPQSDWLKTTSHLVFARSSVVRVYLHTVRGSEIRCQAVIQVTCRDAFWCQVWSDELNAVHMWSDYPEMDVNAGLNRSSHHTTVSKAGVRWQEFRADLTLWLKRRNRFWSLDQYWCLAEILG